MAFADVAKAHAQYVTDHVRGESVTYYHGGTGLSETLSAVVDRRPANITGEVLANVIDVFISKGDLSVVVVDSDRITITGEHAGIYQVMLVISHESGHWLLRAMR